MATSDPRPWGASPAGSDAAVMMRYDAGKRSAALAYALWFFLGAVGGHRFYLGRVGSAVTMLAIALVSFVLSFVLIGYLGYAVLGVWWLVDAFLIPGMVQSHNERLIAALTSGGR